MIQICNRFCNDKRDRNTLDNCLLTEFSLKPKIWDPVCGEDGVTYGNRCQAECEDIKIVSPRECPEACLCVSYFLFFFVYVSYFCQPKNIFQVDFQIRYFALN